MPIISKTSQSKQFSTLTATGEISPSEIVATAKSFYKKQPSYNVLWDFRYAYFQALISSDEFENITTYITKLIWKSKSAGKTAIVASTNLWFSLARTHATVDEIRNLSHKLQVFRFMDEAIKWLGSEN